LSPLATLRAEGVVAFSDDALPVMDASLMREAMQVASELGCPIISHCEDLNLSRGGAVDEGEVADRLNVKGIPHTAEDVMTARDITLATDTQAHLHLAHVSTARSMKMVRMAKDRGVHVTAEVTPHHLVLTSDAVLRLGANAKVNPPLRTSEDREALQAALKDGTVDAVATDHAPHDPEEKASPIQEAPFGIIGLETALPVVLSLVHRGVIGLDRAVQLLTIGPARSMGLPSGTLKKGQPADLVVVDLDGSFRVDVNRFRSKARNCPFDGWSLPGALLLTLVGGTVVFENKVLLQEADTMDVS
jgi:dihydroorotase